MARVVVVLGLVVLTGLVLAALAPLAAGYSAHVVTSGSMAPRVNPGDVVVTHPVTAAELRTGQVLLVHDPEVPGGLLLHRLVSFDEEGRLVTRGDANQSDDSVHPDPADVLGLAVLRVPWVGLPALWRLQGRHGALALTAGVLVAAAVFASRAGRRRAAGGEPGDEPEQLGVDPDAPTVWDIPPVPDPDLVREASSVRRLPPVPVAQRAPQRPLPRALPPVPAARPRRQTPPAVVAAIPIHPASSSSAAVRLSKTGAVRPAVRSFARPAVSTTGGEGNSAPATRQPRPPATPAMGGLRGGRVAAPAPGPRVRPARDHGDRADSGSFRGQPRR
ncbi:signal peptidase I [Blastococcus litoris]|uniref:signal peptidase I n=1 Tax=Blastococcus litoris TaxID=2171622 RepID=UPI0013DFE5C9|nr:signal peptidase I [Blastococcus litoris]